MTSLIKYSHMITNPYVRRDVHIEGLTFHILEFFVNVYFLNRFLESWDKWHGYMPFLVVRIDSKALSAKYLWGFKSPYTFFFSSKFTWKKSLLLWDLPQTKGKRESNALFTTHGLCFGVMARWQRCYNWYNFLRKSIIWTA